MSDRLAQQNLDTQDLDTQDLDTQNLDKLRAQYLDLINHQLPAAAKSRKMPVRFNHCFARIVLDNLCQGCWYNAFSRKQPAYRQLSEAQLQAAIVIARSMLQSPKTAIALNQNSLRWRGKL